MCSEKSVRSHFLFRKCAEISYTIKCVSITTSISTSTTSSFSWCSRAHHLHYGICNCQLARHFLHNWCYSDSPLKQHLYVYICAFISINHSQCFILNILLNHWMIRKYVLLYMYYKRKRKNEKNLSQIENTVFGVHSEMTHRVDCASQHCRSMSNYIAILLFWMAVTRRIGVIWIEG